MDIELKYKIFLAGRWCVVPHCGEPTLAHHLRSKGLGGGTSLKPNDLTRIPLCHGHHNELHSKGILTFEKKYGLDLVRELVRTLQAFIYFLGENGI